MAIDVYLQIDGISGESQDEKHRDWIEVSHVNWSIHQPRPRIIERTPLHGNMQRGGGPILYETDTGEPVNELEDGVYEVLDTGKQYVRK